MVSAHRDTQIHRRVDSGTWFASESRNEVAKTSIASLYIGYRYTVKRYILLGRCLRPDDARGPALGERHLNVMSFHPCGGRARRHLAIRTRRLLTVCRPIGSS